MILEKANARSSIICRSESVGISIFIRFSQLKNEHLDIFEILEGIKISSILVLENAFDPIICKLELVGISTFFSNSQFSNAFGEMILILDGRWISSISRLTNRRLLNSSSFWSILPNKYLLSLNMNLSFIGEISIFFNLLISWHQSSPNSCKLAGKYISSILVLLNAYDSIICKLESVGILTLIRSSQ